MEQDTKETLDRAADTTLAEPVTLIVGINPTSSIHRLLQKWGICSKKRVLQIRPIVLGNLIRISKLLLSIDTGGLTKDKLLEGNYQLMENYADPVARIVATAIHNSKSDPPQDLVNFILFNFTSKELQKVLNIVIRQMDVNSFMTSIILARGLNVLDSGQRKNGSEKVSPSIQGS